MKPSLGKTEVAVAEAVMAAEGLAVAVTEAAMGAGENTRTVLAESHTPFPSHAAGKGGFFPACNMMQHRLHFIVVAKAGPRGGWMTGGGNRRRL